MTLRADSFQIIVHLFAVQESRQHYLFEYGVRLSGRLVQGAACLQSVGENNKRFFNNSFASSRPPFDLSRSKTTDQSKKLYSVAIKESKEINNAHDLTLIKQYLMRYNALKSTRAALVHLDIRNVGETFVEEHKNQFTMIPL